MIFRFQCRLPTYHILALFIIMFKEGFVRAIRLQIPPDRGWRARGDMLTSKTSQPLIEPPLGTGYVVT
jgi:hypothetical protein